ncbi:MAG: hypothetical protein ISR77_35380 [Pirellulaceae bacterium]|nr:hypothetical protein [Pirellulaceae bacterium]
MRFSFFPCAVLALALSASAADNPCTNGSFEDVTPGGFPVDWGPVGDDVKVVSDAHTGERALRLARTADTATLETGINRASGPNPQDGGAMLDRLRGGIDFWYKAVSAENAQLCVYAIPMNEEPREGSGSQRATFVVPATHIGDGQWHHGRLKYDFTENSKVRWVHFAARIVGTAGELLLDDFSHVDRVGVILRVGTIRLEEDANRPGECCVVRAKIENAGDANADDVQASIELPNGLKAENANVPVGRLAPGDAVRAMWTVNGGRKTAQSWNVVAKSGDVESRASFDLAPALTIRSFGPVMPVTAVGPLTPIECVLENTGNVFVKKPTAEFLLAEKTIAKTIEQIPPGRSVTLRADVQPSDQSPDVKVSVCARAENIDGELTAESSLVVGALVDTPTTTGRPQAAVTDDYAILANEYVRLVLRGNEFGVGPAELSVAKSGKWQPVAWLPRLCRVVYRDEAGQRVERTVFSDQQISATPGNPGLLQVQWTEQDDDGAKWSGSVRFELASRSHSITASYDLGCDKPRDLLAFDGPMLYVLERDEAVFPGLEWLVDDEVSSDSLDIAEDHPDRKRYVVHPNKITIPAIGIHSRFGTVGLLWDVHQRWDGQRDKPSAVFASPDRFGNQRAHLAGLFLPTVPEFVEENAREAATPYPVKPDRPLRLEATIFADAQADSPLAAIDAWAQKHGFPKPAPLPHGSYEGEIEFSMQAYLKSLWLPETQEWWLTKGNTVMSKTGRPRSYVADLLVGSMLSPSQTVAKQCRDRVEDVIGLVGCEPRLDAARFGRRADLGYANPGHAAGLVYSRDERGAWRFDADLKPKDGPFEGRDYYELGPDNAVEVGTCARNAYEVLRYARIAGDWEAFDEMQRTLALMEKFRVPRAAQVWEVPVHTPDVLAAADAVDAYVEAYRFTRNKRWLHDAVTWADRGLPFIYLWEDPDKPFLLGASIPVFGATWHRGSWFGRPVQWNGLRYAVALLRLAEHDDSKPWRQIAETVIHSAIHQQEPSGDEVALWPDAISAIDSSKSAWIFGPQGIIEGVLKLSGRDPEPTTVILGEGRRTIHISAAASFPRVGRQGTSLVFDVSYRSGEQGVVLVSNIGRPNAVQFDGVPIAERSLIEREKEPCWRYDAGNAYLSVRVPRDDVSTIRVDGAPFREVRRLPWLATELRFEFDQARDGWLPANDIDDLLHRGLHLVGRIAGPDPYLIRSPIRVEGDAYPLLRLRMRLTAGSGGQLFWTTESSPDFDEEKAVRFSVVPDNQFHEYRLELSRNPMWAGQIITAIRLDPTSGVNSGEFAIDYLRGERP